MKQIGVWRSWLAHLVWDQRVQCSSHCTLTKRMIFGSSFFCFPPLRACFTAITCNFTKIDGHGQRKTTERRVDPAHT